MGLHRARGVVVMALLGAGTVTLTTACRKDPAGGPAPAPPPPTAPVVVSSPPPDPRAALASAIVVGRRVEALELIENGADVNYSGPGSGDPKRRFSPLFCATYRPDMLDVLEVLVKRGANLEQRALGLTPLHNACLWENAEAVDVLLAHGADRHARAPRGGAALHLAAGGSSGLDPRESERVRICRVLLKAGADVKAVNEKSSTPLHEAAGARHAGVATFLIISGAEVNARDEDGLTPLHLAARGRRWAGHEMAAETCAVLLKAGADVNAPDARGQTPLDLAQPQTGSNSAPAVKLLIKSGGKRASELDQPPTTRARGA